MDTPKDDENLDSSQDDSEQPQVSRRLGFLKGQFTVPEDFDTMMADEIEEMFYGNPDKFADLQDEKLPEVRKARASRPSSP
jgi:hypothetical protein